MRSGPGFQPEGRQFGVVEHAGADDEAVAGGALDAESGAAPGHDVDREVGVLPVLEACPIGAGLRKK